MKRFVTSIFVLLCLACCTRQSPQVPSQRKSSTPPVDSTQLALLELNQQLAQTADHQLAALVQTLDEPYALYDGNAWATILFPGETDSPSPAPNEEWTVHMCVYSLSGQLLTDSEATYRIGKQELPPAVEANIGEWHRGARVRMYVPWYSAFGLRGTETIPPYENVIIETELK